MCRKFWDQLSGNKCGPFWGFFQLFYCQFPYIFFRFHENWLDGISTYPYTGMVVVPLDDLDRLDNLRCPSSPSDWSSLRMEKKRVSKCLRDSDRNRLSVEDVKIWLEKKENLPLWYDYRISGRTVAGFLVILSGFLHRCLGRLCFGFLSIIRPLTCHVDWMPDLVEHLISCCLGQGPLSERISSVPSVLVFSAIIGGKICHLFLSAAQIATSIAFNCNSVWGHFEGYMSSNFPIK